MIYKINEEMLGIAEPTLFYVDLLTMRSTGEFYDFIDRTKDLPENREAKEVKMFTFSYSDIKRFVTDWDEYAYFPVSQIQLEVTFQKKKADSMMGRDVVVGNSITTPEMSHKVSAYAMPFGKPFEAGFSQVRDPIKMNNDHSLLLNMGIEFMYGSKFIKSRHEGKVLLEVESIILHELNHLYEFYNRSISGRDPIQISITDAGAGENEMKRPFKIFRYWQWNFTIPIYQTEPHEIRAYVQEAKPFVDKLSFTNFKKTEIWKNAKAMEDFDYKVFLGNLKKVIYKHNPSYVDTMIDTLVNDFKVAYKKALGYFDENPKYNFDKMSTEEFFQFWEKKIRQTGQILIKKMSRLYAYKDIKQSEIL